MTYQLHEPAAPEVVLKLSGMFPHLPADYFAFLRRANGGEGLLGISPGYFVLWPAQDVPEFSSNYEVSEYVPGYVAVGSSGGGELFVFPLSGKPDGIYMVPAIGMEVQYVSQVAPSFAEFEAEFGGNWP